MMVIVDSPPPHFKNIDQQAKEETVVCLHQLERTGQVSWDQNDPVVMMCQDQLEEEEEPSISMIAKMNQIEGSMLFSPRMSNRRISLVEEAVIIETLNKGR